MDSLDTVRCALETPEFLIPSKHKNQINLSLIYLSISDLNKSIVIDAGESSSGEGITMFRTAVKVTNYKNKTRHCGVSLRH